MRKIASIDSNAGSSRSRLRGSREWTMSTSNVFTGAPRNTADNPPTRMKSTCASANARRIAENLVSIQFADREDFIRVAFGEFEPLGRSEREHPADQRQIDAVRAVIRLRRGIR